MFSNRRFQEVSSYDACWFDPSRLLSMSSDHTLGTRYGPISPPPLEAGFRAAMVTGTKRCTQVLYTVTLPPPFSCVGKCIISAAEFGFEKRPEILFTGDLIAMTVGI